MADEEEVDVWPVSFRFSYPRRIAAVSAVLGLANFYVQMNDLMLIWYYTSRWNFGHAASRADYTLVDAVVETLGGIATVIRLSIQEKPLSAGVFGIGLVVLAGLIIATNWALKEFQGGGDG